MNMLYILLIFFYCSLNLNDLVAATHPLQKQKVERGIKEQLYKNLLKMKQSFLEKLPWLKSACVFILGNGHWLIKGIGSLYIINANSAELMLLMSFPESKIQGSFTLETLDQSTLTKDVIIKIQEAGRVLGVRQDLPVMVVKNFVRQP